MLEESRWNSLLFFDNNRHKGERGRKEGRKEEAKEKKEEECRGLGRGGLGRRLFRYRAARDRRL